MVSRHPERALLLHVPRAAPAHRAVQRVIRRTKFGTGLVAIREDEGKAAAIGVNTTRYKIDRVRRVSTFFIGVAGGVYAYFLTFLNPVGAFTILGA